MFLAESVSIVVPVQNEAESLPSLVKELAVLSDELDGTLEILVIDDGSTDTTWATLETLCKSYTFLHAAKLTRNFGKSIALQTGILAVQTSQLVTMDGDLQDDPLEIPKMLAKLDAGFDVVSGWKHRRMDSLTKRISSRAFNLTLSALSGVWLHDHNCGLKAYRREVFENLELRDGLHRFIPVLAARNKFRIAEAIVNHRLRQFGRSHYGWKRMIEAMRDLFGIMVFRKGLCRNQSALRAESKSRIAETIRWPENAY